jgi:hypothetical protein
MNRHGYRNVFMLMLITLYVAGTGFIVLYGARFYSDMIARSKQTLQVRTALSYFNNRIKQNDQQGIIEVRTDEHVIVFKQEAFFILVYEENGYLVEQNSTSDQIMTGAAQRIAQVSELSFVLEGRFLRVTFTDETGKVHILSYVLMSEGAAS